VAWQGEIRALVNDTALESLAGEGARLVSLLTRREEKGKDDTGDMADHARSAFGARDRAELLRLGASTALGDGTPLSDQDELAIEIFDALLSPEVHRLVPFNHVRGELEQEIAPRHRRRFWWRFEGVGLDPAAWDALASVAALVARFDAARQRFEALVAVERVLKGDAAAKAALRSLESAKPETAQVIALGRARRGRVVELARGVRVAAAGEPALSDPFADAPIVHEDSAVEVRFKAGDGGFGLRVIVWGEGAAGLDERRAVLVTASSGESLAPREGLALPTLWWGFFEGARPATVDIVSPARRIELPRERA